MEGAYYKYLIVLGIMYCAFGVMPSMGDILYVDGDAPGVQNGTSWTNAYNYLQDALYEAAAGDTIRVAQGIYTPDANSAVPAGSGNRNATFQLVNGVSLQGGYAGHGTADPNARDIAAYESILSGDLNGNDGPGFTNNEENSYSVVTGSGTNSSAIMDSFTISSGNADGDAIAEKYGAGMYIDDGSCIITNCRFEGNSAYIAGGGIHGGNPEITNCIFVVNVTDRNGGGVSNCNGPKTGCTFVDNYAGRYGGAIYDSGGQITNCFFIDNSAAQYGGGLFECSGRVTNCIFNSNSAGYKGGGIYGAFDTENVFNCTFTGNSAGQEGGGTWGKINLTNCILWADTPEEIFDGYGSPVVTYSDVQGGYSGEGNISSDPLFLDVDGSDNIPGTQDDELSLLLGSLCIDAGDNNSVPPEIVTDIVGNPRIVDGIVDMGAYEYEGTEAGSVIRIIPATFEFSAYEDGPDPEDQVLSIWNGGVGTLNWLISPDCNWIESEPNNGTSTGDVNVVTLSVSISGLSGGIYDCILTISDPCALNSPQLVSVRLDMTGPVIGVSTSEFIFDANEGGANPANQILAIGNTGGGTLDWEIACDCNWLAVEPNSGSSTGETDFVTLSVDVNGLEDGIYDCNLIISDPDAQNNPVIVNVRLELTEVWRDYIVFPDDPLASDVIFESETGWVKFTIKLDDPCTVYFQNSKLYPFHYHFATEWLEPFIGMSVQEFYDVALYDANQLASLGAVILPPMTGNPPEPEFAEYGIQFVRYDPYTKEQIAAMFMAVKNKVSADPCVTAYYFPSYEQQQVAQENQAWFESQGIPIGSVAQWYEGNICYSEGWAIGDLKYFPADQIQNAYINGELLPEDILLTDGVPAEVPYVAGIVTLSPSTQNSHVAILSKTYGIPFVYLAKESDINDVWQLVNDLTLLCVFESGGICNVQLKDALAEFTPEEVNELFVMKTVTPLEISPMEAYGNYDADTNSLLPEDINHFGGKASNYGILRTSIPENCPNAVALSFDLWNDFLDQPLVPCDSVIMPPNGYVVFWADDDLDQGATHAGFKLGKSGEDIGLFDANGIMIDGFSFASQTTDVSYGRTPDGNDNWSFFSGGDISPNAPNPGGAGITGEGLFINEFMADNDSVVADEYGEYDDWIEIYNSDSAAIDLGGMYLTDDLEDPTKWMIPVGITGSTLREEIANRLAGYTYPVYDLEALSVDLAVIRNIITNPGITSFSPQMQDAIIAVLQNPNYGFDSNSKIRFRSSTNVEDAEKFTGAGLYNSYSGCLADDLDGDESGPCICDPGESNERGVFRAIRKVFASFYNENAFLERLRHDVNEADVGMALLVHHSFPDEFELANGVATVEKKLSPPHWDIMLATQKGATPVTNPEQGALPEEVSVYAETGGAMAMTLIRQSNLVILGETVMDWQQDYNDLTALLVVAAQRFEQVTGKTEYILDFEYKKVAPGGAAIPAGGIVVKQIREIPPLDDVSSTCPSFSYTCTPPQGYCLVELTYEDQNVSIETSYIQWCLAFCPDFYGFCRTTIKGYTTRPIVMFTGYAEATYFGHHCYWSDFYFIPSNEPGMSPCLLNQLRAKDIRTIHLHSGGGVTVETTGFEAGPYYLGDFESDGDIDFMDFAELAQRWLKSDCGQCGGVDLNCDESVDLEDMQVFINNWLVSY